MGVSMEGVTDSGNGGADARRRWAGRVRTATSAGIAAVLLVAGGSLWLTRSAGAADHLDPPERTNIGTMSDTAADIADVFLWNTASTVTVAVTGAGPKEAGIPATYDTDVVYVVHLSNDGDPTTDEATINVRYGKNPSGDWGVQFQGIPSLTAPLQGPVQTILTQGEVVKATAGLFDDPFFFDLQGFNDTKATGTLSITNTRNFFAGKNDTSFVVEFPRSAIESAGHPITGWVETRRISAAG
jgi:hypothetical protein